MPAHAPHPQPRRVARSRVAPRDTAPRRRWTLLGRVQTTAPAAALRRALNLLRPQLTLRVRRDAAAANAISATGAPARYCIEVAADEAAARGAAIAPWLRVKSALLAAFPADKPNPVRALD